MAGRDFGAEVESELKELIARRLAENPFIPTNRVTRRSHTPSTAGPEASVVPLTSARRLLRTQASPSVAATDGTRSPSTVPDRSPASQLPTSLRTVASIDSRIGPTALGSQVEELPQPSVQSQSANVEMVITDEAEAMPLDEPMTIETGDQELSDADDEESESALGDDLQLEREEHIVPLFIEGRQHDTYSAYIQQKKGILESFTKEPHSFDAIADVEAILAHMRAIETHLDLVFAEADQENTATQIEFAAEFGLENSVKFRFLHSLFHSLRDESKHLVLVTDEDNDSLFRILETLCRAKHINYRIPTMNRQADPSYAQGALNVTIVPSEASHIMRAPDLIICIDGMQEARQIRQKYWAKSVERDVVPVLHLVIPRTVGHIERYMTPDPDRRSRMHTTLASLAQLRGDLGKAIDEDTPSAAEAAKFVAEWLLQYDQNGPYDWPLPSIGSVKDVIEFQTQASRASSASPAPERNKRPLEDEDLDTAKRMRFTPQPQAIPGPSMHHEHEISHISDSMAGSAENDATLRKQLARAEDELQVERNARKAAEKEFYEKEADWDKRQTNFEDLERDYRLLLGKFKSTSEELETANKTKASLQERLSTRTAELREVVEQLEAQRKTDSLSADDKIRAITILRIELAAAQEEAKRALSNKQSAESMFEYQNEQRRNAQDAASASQATVDELTKQNAQLQRQASGEPARLKALHLDKHQELQTRQINRMMGEIKNLRLSLKQREDEVTRVKSNVGRVGYGTRAQSATPQPPKVRSRAGSPMGGRLSNLRNGGER